MELADLDRLKVYRMIKAALYNTLCPFEAITDLATAIEGGCVNIASKQCLEDGQTGEMVSRYSLAAARACAAIDPRSSAAPANDWVIRQMQSGEIDPGFLGGTEAARLNPERNQEVLNRVQRSMQSKIKKKVSETKICKFCSAKQVSWYEVQTRSLDEPKTIFNNCEACGLMWVG